MRSSKILLKNGQTVDLVDGRIDDSDISSWNNKLNVDGSNATTAGVTAMMKKVSSGTDSLNDESTYFGDSNADHTHIVRRPVLNLWNYIKKQISSVLGLTSSSYSGNAATATKPAVTTLTESDNLNNVCGSTAGDVLLYKWAFGNSPANVPIAGSAVMEVVRTHSDVDDITQTVYTAFYSVYRRECLNGTWGGWYEYSKSTHTHGNITSGGALQTTDVAIANGDKLVITDASDSRKVAMASISFDGSTTTKALTKKGTWESFAKTGDITTAIQALDVSSVGGDGKYIAAISETDGKISATATSLATAPVSGSNVAITAGGVYTALAAKQDAIPDAGSAANPVHFKDGKAVAGDRINNCKLTLKVGDATVGDGFTANAGADVEYRVTGNQIASALNAGTGISISGNTVSTNLPLSKDIGVTVKKGVWYIFAMANVDGGAWERCWDFLIASNHNSSAQMRLFISPRISASGLLDSDTMIQVEGHVTPTQLAKYKIAVVKDSSGELYCCLCVNHSNSNEYRTVHWNLRNARGIHWWAESTPLSNYTVVSERLLSTSMPSNRLVCYKPTNNAEVGNATQPVYVDAYGMIKACSSMPKFVIGTPAGDADTIYFT